MAQEDNFFALLGDKEGDDMLKLINRVKEEAKKNSSAVERVQKEKKVEKKIAHQIPTDMRAKRLVLPSHVRRSFIVFDKKKEREKAEAEARRKAEEEAKAKVSGESNGEHREDCGIIGASENKTGEQALNGNFSYSADNNTGQSTNLNGYQDGYRGRNNYHRRDGRYNYQRNNNREANGYQKNTQGSYKGSNGYQLYNQRNSGVSNGDQVNNGEDSSGIVGDDGWQYV